MTQPWFSVIMPTYNSSGLVRRALESCTRQDFGDFEVIVIDSASTDGTADVVRAFNNPRVRLVEEAVRRGVCAARNVGVAAARGEWVALLDSDDELPDGAFKLMYEKTLEAGDDVAQIRFMCQWDTGQRTPNPPLGQEVWGYEGYLRFVERCVGGNGETMSCIRRSTFEALRFPDDRSYETCYHLDFAQRFKTATYPLVARIYHTDSPNQNGYIPNPAHWLRVAPDNARSLDDIISRHGAALRRSAPTAYGFFLRSAAKHHYLSGHRLVGTRYLAGYLQRRPLSAVGWAMLAGGLLGARPFAWLDSVRARLRPRRA